MAGIKYPFVPGSLLLAKYLILERNLLLTNDRRLKKHNDKVFL